MKDEFGAGDWFSAEQDSPCERHKGRIMLWRTAATSYAHESQE
jgi:hypothetical protein